MNYQNYRNAIFKIWDIVSNENFEPYSTDEEKTNVNFGLCNPEFNLKNHSTNNTPCPFDARSEKDIDDRPCIDFCHFFVKKTKTTKLKIIMSKFMCKFVTKEGIESLKSLAKACRGQNGVSEQFMLDLVKITNKVVSSTDRFGGFDFNISNGVLSAKRRE